MPDTVHTSRLKRFIGWLETYTKTDLSYLGAGGFWLTIDQIAGGLIAFVLIVAFAHFVTPEAYGTYRYLLATLWTLAAFTLTGLPTALAQAVARGFEGAFKKSFWWSVIGGIPMGLIGLGMSVYYFAQGNSTLAYGSLIIGILGPLMQPSYIFGAYLTGKKDFRMMAFLGALFAAVPAIGLLIAMLFTQSPVILFLIYLGGTVLAGMVLFLVTLRLYSPNDSLNTDLRELAGHFSVMNLLSTVAGQVDKLVVFHYLGAVDLAVYSFATAMPEQIRGIFSAVTTLALPKFAQRPIKEIRHNFWFRLWGFAALIGIASLAYILLAPLLFEIFLPKYMSAVGYSQLFALSLIGTVGVPTSLLQAHGAKRELYILNIVSPIVQIGALIVLTAFYGLVGTVVARIVTRIFSFLLSATLAWIYMLRSHR